MDPGQASTQDQSVQALMIQLCELKKCVGTVQWAEPPSTLRQKILTRIGCEHKGLSCIHTRLGGYRVYGLNPELWAIPPLPPLPFLFFFPVSVKWFSSPALAPLSCFHPLSRLPQTNFETTHSPASIGGKQKQLGFPSVFLDSECFLDQLIHLPPAAPLPL